MQALLILTLLVSLSTTHTHASASDPFDPVAKNLWLQKYGQQTDQLFSGPLAFSHLPYRRCLDDTAVEAGADSLFDVALLGMPFDTGTSYRPGARFGPHAIRAGSRRQRATRGHTLAWGANPYTAGYAVVDCGDVPVSPFDNALAMDQMEVAYATLLARPVATPDALRATRHLALDGKEHPRIITLGGDHTVVLPILRALHAVYGPVSVLHFDAHLDTFMVYPGQPFVESRVTHGTFFNLAYEERLMTNTSVHAGIRGKVTGIEDLAVDASLGFQIISTEDIDDLGIPEIVIRIRARIGDSPVYLSFDIDVIDPGLAPGTGTPDAGGWTVREAKRILRGLTGLNWVGADLVEVSPAYDHAEVTGITAADLVHDFLTMFSIVGPPASAPNVPKTEKHHPSRDEL